MNTLEAIFKRRSIRKYTAQPVTDEQITTLLRAAMAAPTACNCQEWEFIVVRDKNLLQQITQVHPYAQMLTQADCAVLVCGNLQREHMPDYWIADCGAAAQNILLAATELGLGSVWLGVYPNQDRMQALGKLFHLPEHILPLNVIALGYPDEHKEEADRFDKAKVHYDTW